MTCNENATGTKQQLVMRALLALMCNLGLLSNYISWIICESNCMWSERLSRDKRHHQLSSAAQISCLCLIFTELFLCFKNGLNPVNELFLTCNSSLQYRASIILGDQSPSALAANSDSGEVFAFMTCAQWHSQWQWRWQWFCFYFIFYTDCAFFSFLFFFAAWFSH